MVYSKTFITEHEPIRYNYRAIIKEEGFPALIWNDSIMLLLHQRVSNYVSARLHVAPRNEILVKYVREDVIS